MRGALGLLVISILLVSCSEELSSKVNFVHKPAPNKEVAAKIGDIEIKEDEILKGMETEYYQAQKALYDLKFNGLKNVVLKKLIESDANKGDLSQDEFIKKYIIKDKEPTDAEINAFLQERKIPKEQVNAQLKQRIVSFLKNEMNANAIDAWMAKKTKDKPIEVYFNRPQRPYFDVAVGNAPTFGKGDAKVTIIEYSDFQCPYCARAAETLKQIKKKYGNKVQIAFKQFPLNFHNHARNAAHASLCASEQSSDSFWKMHDKMFENQQQLDNDGLKKLAKESGLNIEKYDQCMSSKKFDKQITEEINEGNRLGIRSTPTFFVNGRLISGAQPIEVFSEEIDQYL